MVHLQLAPCPQLSGHARQGRQNPWQTRDALAQMLLCAPALPDPARGCDELSRTGGAGLLLCGECRGQLRASEERSSESLCFPSKAYSFPLSQSEPRQLLPAGSGSKRQCQEQLPLPGKGRVPGAPCAGADTPPPAARSSSPPPASAAGFKP